MAESKHAEFDDLLREHRTFPPPAEFRRHAHVHDETLRKSTVSR